LRKLLHVRQSRRADLLSNGRHDSVSFAAASILNAAASVGAAAQTMVSIMTRSRDQI
jgi:hypothetical protein